MKRLWKAVLLAALIGFLLLWLGPQTSGPSVNTIPVRNLSNARQMGLAARLYSEDHQGKFPFDLTECVPTFIEASAFENLRFDSREKSNQPSRPKFDWLYFGAFFEERNPPPLLIASPQTFVAGATRKRIIVLGDLSASIVLEEKYQELLRKTIEAMRQRRGETKTE